MTPEIRWLLVLTVLALGCALLAAARAPLTGVLKPVATPPPHTFNQPIDILTGWPTSSFTTRRVPATALMGAQ